MKRKYISQFKVIKELNVRRDLERCRESPPDFFAQTTLFPCRPLHPDQLPSTSFPIEPDPFLAKG